PAGARDMIRLDVTPELYLGSGAGNGVRSQPEFNSRGVQSDGVGQRIEATVVIENVHLIIPRIIYIILWLVSYRGFSKIPLIIDLSVGGIRILHHKFGIRGVAVDNGFVQGERNGGLVVLYAETFRNQASVGQSNRQADASGIVDIKGVAGTGLTTFIDPLNLLNILI